MKDLNDMKREDIFDLELIGEGLPDLETEIAKMSSDFDDQGSQGEDIFGFADKKKDSEEEDFGF